MEHFFEHGMWIVLTYALVVVAMGVDLVTGVRKSRKSGQAINSRGINARAEGYELFSADDVPVVH